jgi:hypothetical protein
LKGYNGDKHPFAALMLNEAFQEKYREWWRVLLQTPSPETGRRLVDEPALFGAVIQNKDSFFFWTFPEENIPEPQLAVLEGQFARSLIERYGSLTNAIVHFAFDGSRRSVKPGFWMQHWTLMAPTMAGEFSAAALIYRKGLIDPGKVMAELHLSRDDLFSLEGTPLPQDGSFDVLRLLDVPDASPLPSDTVIDPLIHFVGRTKVEFNDKAGEVHLENFQEYTSDLGKRLPRATLNWISIIRTVFY